MAVSHVNKRYTNGIAAGTVSGRQAPRGLLQGRGAPRRPASSLSIPAPHQSLGHRKQLRPLPPLHPGPCRTQRGVFQCPLEGTVSLPGSEPSRGTPGPSESRPSSSLLSAPPFIPGPCCLAGLGPHHPSSTRRGCAHTCRSACISLQRTGFLSADFAHVAPCSRKPFPRSLVPRCLKPSPCHGAQKRLGKV